MSYRQFIKDVLIIGSTQILSNSSNFILLLIISKMLGVYDYGVWSQLSVTVSLLTSLAILALSTAFVRFFSSKTDTKEISKGFFSMFFFIAVLSLAIMGILFVSSVPLSQFLFQTSDYSRLIQVTSMLILLNALYTLVIFYFRTYRQMAVYTGLVLFTSVGQMMFTIFLLFVLGYGIYGVVFSAFISYLIPLCLGLGIIVKQTGFSFPSFSEIPKYLRFSLPLAPSSLMYWITDSSDRYIVGFILGTVSVGVYSAAYNIGYLVYVFVLPLQIILFPQLSKLHDAGELEEVKIYLSYSLKFFLLIAVPFVAGLTVLAKQILIIVTTMDFVEGAPIIPLVALSAVFSGVFLIIQNICILYKKTTYNFWIQVCSALLNIGLNLVLIPVIGIIGAAFATLFSFIAMSILAYVFSKKFLRFTIDVVFISKIVLASMIMGVLVLFLSERIGLLYQIFIGIALYFVLCYALSIFNKDEISFFKNMLLFSKQSK